MSYDKIFEGRESCGTTWGKSWGGGNWMDRVGLGSLRQKEQDSSESISTTEVPEDKGDESDVTDEKLDDLTEDKARLAQMRAMRRRALTARFNKADTIRTGGRGATDYA